MNIPLPLITTGRMVVILLFIVVVFIVGPADSEDIARDIVEHFSQNDDNVNVSVPIEHIPAYHIIKDDEFITVKRNNETLPSNAVHNISPYVNYYTLGSLEAGDPFSNETLFELQDLTGEPTVMGIPATLVTSLGGKLEKGDVTDLIIPSFQGKEPLEIRNVTVLDIIGNTSDSASAEITIVVVLPRENAIQIINETDEDMAFAIRTLDV